MTMAIFSSVIFLISTFALSCFCDVGDQPSCNRPRRPKDCQQIYDTVSKCSGDYTIFLGPYLKPVKVFCQMDDVSRRGCIVFQRRMYGSEDFHRGWAVYARGFGDIHAEHWLGNDNLYMITNQDNYTLRINMRRFNGESGEVRYSTFKLDAADKKYTLHVGGFSTSGDPWHDSLADSNGMKFSTYDQDNDDSYSTHCASLYEQAWWMNSCFLSALNGAYIPADQLPAMGMGILWELDLGNRESLQFTEMAICPQ